MHRALRYLGYGFGGAIALVICALAGFRTAAMLRETIPAGSWAPSSGAFVEIEGLSIHYREWGPPEGPPVLLVHGTLAWAGTWYEIAERLATKGYRVIAPDMPPFGYSQRPADHDYTRAAQGRRILAFADALKLDRFALTGHSFGGGATIEAAFAQPQRIDGLILLDVALGLASPNAPPPAEPVLGIKPLRELIFSATLTNPLAIGFGLRDFIHDDSVVTNERIALYRQPLSVSGTTEGVGHWFMRGLFGNESASHAAGRSAYRGFTPPVLIIWGKQDTVTPLAQGEEIHALFGDSQLEVLDDVNHIPHVENPDAVAGLMASFMKRLPRSDAAASIAHLRNSTLQLRGTLVD